MALTISNITYDVEKDKRVVKATITFDSSYPTGGESFTPADLGLKQVDDMVTEAGIAMDTATNAGGGSLKLGGSSTSPKVLVYVSGAEVANASNLATLACKVRFYGS